MPIVVGQFFSMIGSVLSSLALGIWAYQETGSVTLYALITACAHLPGFLISPFAGALVDRMDRRSIIIFSEAGMLLSALMMAFLFTFHTLHLWQIYIIAAFSSICMAFIRSAYGAIVPFLVKKKDLGRANGLFQIAIGGAQIIAPILAGTLVATVGISSALWLDTLTFIFPVIVMLFMKIPNPDFSKMDESGKGSILSQSLFGMNYIAKNPGIMGILIFSGLFSFLTGMIIVLFTPLMLAFSSSIVMGALISFGGFGMLAGSVIMGIWGGPKKRVLGMIGFALGCGIFMSLVGLRAFIPLIAGSVFIYLFCYPISIGSTQVILQSKVPIHVQGRVFALNGMFVSAGVPLASILSGPLADKVFEPLMAQGGLLAAGLGPVLGVGKGRGIGLMFILVGLLTIITCVCAFLYAPLRNIEKIMPDVIRENEENETGEEDPDDPDDTIRIEGGSLGFESPAD